MNSTLRNILMASSALGALGLGAPAWAQAVDGPTAGQTSGATTAPASSAPVAGADATPEVVVTGSRIERKGFESATPVSVLGAQELRNTGTGTLADSVQTLPQVVATSGVTQNSSGPAGGGQAFVNLRGLGSQRTLSLLDGKRFPTGAGSSAGAVDISQFPSALIERVEVVTGGASAAYGSDAVAGVLNFVINRKFTGVSAEMQGGESEYGDAKEYKASLAVGLTFGSDHRGRLILSGQYYKVDPFDTRPWLDSNTNYILVSGKKMLVDNVTLVNVSPSGVFTNSPVNGGVRGIGFDNSGNPIPFNYGTFAPTTNSQAQMSSGGDGSRLYQLGYNLGGGLQQKIFYGRLSWDFGSNWNVYAEGNFNNNRNSYNQFYNGVIVKICPNNAFLPASLVALVPACVANTTGGANLSDLPRILGRPTVSNENSTRRGVVGFEGKFGDWRVDGYYTHASLTQDIVFSNNLILANLIRSGNAVFSNGAIVCADTLSADPAVRAAAAGCVPVNPFGLQTTGTTAQMNYVGGTSQAHQVNTQDVFSLNINGSPFSLWAGPISVAAGFEHRRDSTRQTTDALSPLSVFASGNFVPFAGVQTVNEGYVETVIPLLKDLPFAQSLEFNGAVRYTNYSLAGGVTTWKAGLTYKPVSDLLFRVTRSRDIRAPSLDLLFSAGANIQTTITDGLNGAFTVRLQPTANPSLVPERANTTTAGVTYQPSQIPGLSLSVDWYNIKLEDAIGSLTPQNTVDLCNSTQSPVTCAQITRVNGVITQVRTIPLNLSTLKTSGLDIEGRFRRNISAGNVPVSFMLHAVANYVHTFTQVGPGIPLQDGAGDVSRQALGIGPHWRGTLQANLDVGPVSVFVQERFVGAGRYGTNATDLTNGFAAPVYVPSIFYTDFNLRYRTPVKGVSVYANITNAFNKAPPFDPAGTFYTNPALYDVVGRFFRIGVNVKY